MFYTGHWLFSENTRGPVDVEKKMQGRNSYSYMLKTVHNVWESLGSHIARIVLSGLKNKDWRFFSGTKY